MFFLKKSITMYILFIYLVILIDVTILAKTLRIVRLVGTKPGLTCASMFVVAVVTHSLSIMGTIWMSAGVFFFSDFFN
jgi:hypothetical protein